MEQSLGSPCGSPVPGCRPFPGEGTGRGAPGNPTAGASRQLPGQPAGMSSTWEQVGKGRGLAGSARWESSDRGASLSRQGTRRDGPRGPCPGHTPPGEAPPSASLPAGLWAQDGECVSPGGPALHGAGPLSPRRAASTEVSRWDAEQRVTPCPRGGGTSVTAATTADGLDPGGS